MLETMNISFRTVYRKYFYNVYYSTFLAQLTHRQRIVIYYGYIVFDAFAGYQNVHGYDDDISESAHSSARISYIIII